MMNERIRQLAEQHERIWNLYSIGPVQKAEVEGFVEAIVRECADIALEQKKWVEDQVVFDPRDQAWNKARIQQSQRIADKIQEHFGVEL